MSPSVLSAQLERLGDGLRRWQTDTRTRLVLSALLLATGVLALADVLTSLGRPARISLWFVLVFGALGAAARILRLHRQTVTPQGVAARIERAFPQLDNRLINRLQFAADAATDPFKQAYLREELSGWSALDFNALRDHRLRRRVNLALGVAVLALLVPALTAGGGWHTAVWRVVHPFGRTAPASLTRILDVSPGNVAVRQGAALTVSCRVAGRLGHPVLLDLKPADGAPVTRDLGRLLGLESETFSHGIEQANTDLAYRFRAGDAPPSDWHRIRVRAPLSLSAATLRVTPPRYTGAPPREWNALEDEIALHDGARVELRLEANAELDAAVLQEPDTALTPVEGTGRRDWKGEITIRDGSTLVLRLTGTDGESLAHTIPFTPIPDHPPRIRVLFPRETATLSPGGVPHIDFEVEDDYGLASVELQQVAADADSDRDAARHTTVAQWDPAVQKDFAARWRSPTPERTGVALTFRLRAVDNRPGEPSVAYSEPIVFSIASLADPEESAPDRPEREAQATVGRLITLQRETRTDTEDALAAIESAGRPVWEALAVRQADVRVLTRTLLDLQGNPLGNLALRVRQLYVHEMAEAAALLGRLPALSPPAARTEPATRARQLQDRILRVLTQAESAVAQTRRERQERDLEALLQALIRGQEDVTSQIRAPVQAGRAVAETLADRQDDLSSDLQAFERFCRREAESVRAHDPDFADLLLRVAERIETRRIRETMLLAADRLEQARPADALPLAEQAGHELRALRAQFEGVRIAGREERMETLQETIADARDRIERIRQLHEQALDAMDALRAQGDVSSGDEELMANEYGELMQTTRDALLEIPVDLHIFTELNVANELIEDVITVFEEILQRPGSELLGPDDVGFQPFSKEDLQEFLDKMAEAGEALDHLEMWMPDSPDNQQITFEAFDEAELPEGGIALNELADRVETLIGDLLEESDALRDAAQDGATNLADGDSFGDAVAEGESTSFEAAGQIGNVRPDHMEQDGRSTIGREGMASGEAAARSGTIEEGDTDIQARRTQDPTQDGLIEAEGGTGAQATGGGKLGTGGAEDFGMAGGERRMDAVTGGSEAGMEALLAERAQTLYQQASLRNVRSHDLQMAAHHLRQAADAVSRGRPIEEIAELRRRAATSLRRAATDLQSGDVTALADAVVGERLEGAFAGSTEEAPPAFRPLVAEYFKRLNDEL